MSIALTFNGTTAHLSERLQWVNEFDWSPVEQATAYSTSGALLLDVATKQAGRPIALDGVQSAAWLSRALCSTLQAWAALPGIELDLLLRGAVRRVVFDHAKGGFSARAVWRLADGELLGAADAEVLYLPMFNFLEV